MLRLRGELYRRGNSQFSPETTNNWSRNNLRSFRRLCKSSARHRVNAPRWQLRSTKLSAAKTLPLNQPSTPSEISGHTFRDSHKKWILLQETSPTLRSCHALSDPVGGVMRSLAFYPQITRVLDTLGEHPQPVDAARAALADRGPYQVAHDCCCRSHCGTVGRCTNRCHIDFRW